MDWDYFWHYIYIRFGCYNNNAVHPKNLSKQQIDKFRFYTNR